MGMGAGFHRGGGIINASDRGYCGIIDWTPPPPPQGMRTDMPQGDTEVVIMALRVKVRRTGRSMATTIPKAVADLHGIAVRDELEVEPIGPGEL